MTENDIEKTKAEIRANFEKELEREQTRTNSLHQAIDYINMLLKQKDINDVGENGLALYGTYPFANNILIMYPRQAVEELASFCLMVYRNELLPLYKEHGFGCKVVRALSRLGRWATFFIPRRWVEYANRHTTILKAIANTQRIMDIINGNDEKGDMLGCNLNAFATYVGYIQVVKPELTKLCFEKLRDVYRIGIRINNNRLRELPKRLKK